MGKVHALIGEQLKAVEAQTSAPVAETSGDALRDGLINKARAVFEKMLTHWNNLSTEEVQAIVDDLTEWEDMATTTIKEMAAETAMAVEDMANSEAVAVVAVPPTVTDPPTPEPEPDVAGQGDATADPPQVPSQLDSLSSAEDGPPSRLEFQVLASKVEMIEQYIKRKQPDFS